MVMTRPPALQIWNFLMKNRKSLNSGLNGCVSLNPSLLHTAVDEQLHVLTFIKLRHGSEGCSFHFEQVPF